jgi:hypothetical protein
MEVTDLHHRRRLSMMGDTVPTYIEDLMKDLRERKKLFDETPPEEVKYWFEYTGPLQVRDFCVCVCKHRGRFGKCWSDSFFKFCRNISTALANPVARLITLRDAMILA